MRGEYDDELEWPFEGSITVDLCYLQEDKGHHSKSLLLIDVRVLMEGLLPV